MTIAAGTKLGRYEIRSQIGAGGVGEVYRARDTELGRDVAVKVLPSSLQTESNERLVRFSLDGRRLAYVSDESGTNEIDVQTFPPSGSKWQVSTNGGYHLAWACNRFLVTKPVGEGTSTPITVVVNWTGDLKP